jgi:hypothetical protein
MVILLGSGLERRRGWALPSYECARRAAQVGRSQDRLATVRDCERPGLTGTERAASHTGETTLTCGYLARSEGLEPPAF